MKQPFAKRIEYENEDDDDDDENEPKNELRP
jgi:hypothetical protein